MTPRRARQSDLSQITRIDALDDDAWSRSRWSTEIDAGRVWLQSQGMAVASVQELDGEWELHRIVVDAAARRAGHGKAMLVSLLALLPGRWHLEVARGNAAAIALYEHLGFDVVGERKNYYRNGDDAVLMSRS